MNGTIYIGGPMRGYSQLNFPAFDAARDALMAQGWVVVSPADLDRDEGFDPTAGDSEDGWLKMGWTEAGVMARDKVALKKCTAMALLPGWEESRGVTQHELPEAHKLGLPIYLYGDGGTLHPYVPPYVPPTYIPTTSVAVEREIEEKLDNPEESVCLTAYNLVRGPRRGTYGHPLDDFSRVGRMWGAIIDGWLRGLDILDDDEEIPALPPELACLMMEAVKISREVNAPRRDNRVDGCGYWDCLQLIVEERERREHSE